jgi:pimeloyl-ACP methyl ester carboxylesterase
MQKPETRYAHAGDIMIAYQVVGGGPLDLLYAQGWVSNIEYAWENPDYARFLTKLGRFSRLIFFDKRGTGLSDREVGLPTLEQRTEDITAVLDTVGSEQAAILGVSEGGNMATLFAATFPERLSCMVALPEVSGRRTILGDGPATTSRPSSSSFGRIGAGPSTSSMVRLASRLIPGHNPGSRPISDSLPARAPPNGSPG